CQCSAEGSLWEEGDVQEAALCDLDAKKRDEDQERPRDGTHGGLEGRETWLRVEAKFESLDGQSSSNFSLDEGGVVEGCRIAASGFTRIRLSAQFGLRPLLHLEFDCRSSVEEAGLLGLLLDRRFRETGVLGLAIHCHSSGSEALFWLDGRVQGPEFDFVRDTTLFFEPAFVGRSRGRKVPLGCRSGGVMRLGLAFHHHTRTSRAKLTDIKTRKSKRTDRRSWRPKRVGSGSWGILDFVGSSCRNGIVVVCPGGWLKDHGQAHRRGIPLGANSLHAHAKGRHGFGAVEGHAGAPRQVVVFGERPDPVDIAAAHILHLETTGTLAGVQADHARRQSMELDLIAGRVARGSSGIGGFGPLDQVIAAAKPLSSIISAFAELAFLVWAGVSSPAILVARRAGHLAAVKLMVSTMFSGRVLEQW
ncbi:hypothetical protein QBC39DRAFT_396916, partial [Podospora conica]